VEKQPQPVKPVNAAKHPACPRDTDYGNLRGMGKSKSKPVKRPEPEPLWLTDTDEVARQIRRIQGAVRAGRLNKYTLAILGEVTASTLTGLERPDWNPLATTLSALVRAMDVYEQRHGKERKRTPCEPAKC
jgi:hypothetical protein